VHSRVEIGAELAGGRTVLRRIRAGGHFAVRPTGPGQVHLVGTLAGPLGGDDVEVRVAVGPGARLAVRGVAATLVYPARGVAASELRLVADVAAGGHLDLAPEPTIVCAGAHLTATTRVTLAAGATLRLLEEVVLGRAREAPGGWRGRTVVTRDGVPVLSHTLRSDVLIGGGGEPARVVATLLDVGGDVRGEPRTHGGAVAMPLAAPGGLLTTATGPDLATVRADVAAVRPAVAYFGVTGRATV
jgi:urease accessory protein